MEDQAFSKYRAQNAPNIDWEKDLEAIKRHFLN